MKRPSEGSQSKDGTISRRELLKGVACGGLVLIGAAGALPACAPLVGEAEESSPARGEAPSYPLPTDEGRWAPPVAHAGRLPSDQGEIHIGDIGTFIFDAGRVETVRPDIFRPGHFSLFDILVHLSMAGDIALDYHFDAAVDTHVIDALDGERGWWYSAHYSAGWFEPNVFRMDLYPYKNNTVVRLDPGREDRIAGVHDSFRKEVQRLAANGGRVIIPELAIRAPGGRVTFQDVVVTPHDLRSDVLQPGVVTALDAIISLAEMGQISNLALTWYERIAGADPVDSYWVEHINDDAAGGGCGFVYESGPREFAGFSGTHIHIPADVRVTVSPEYALWFWICLGRGGL
ncbi:MAG: hypothetical protein ACOC7Y_00190 [Chloroflexota bacterium]